MSGKDQAAYGFVRAWVFHRDFYRCQYCNYARVALNLHHTIYFLGRKRWQYPAWALKTLCAECNEQVGHVGACEAPRLRADCAIEVVTWFWQREACRALLAAPPKLYEAALGFSDLEPSVWKACGRPCPDPRPPHIQAQRFDDCDCDHPEDKGLDLDAMIAELGRRDRR